MSRSLKILLFASALTASTAFADEIPDAGRILKESTPLPSLAPLKELPAFQNPVIVDEQPPDSTLVEVTGFIFTGNTLFSNDELSRLISGCIGKKMTFAGLNDASAAITNAYRKKGYFLASLFFPPQTVKPGMPLVIEISEGVLENIHVETRPVKTRIRTSILEAHAKQVPIEQPLKESSLTSMVIRTNELPNISSRILLEPGSRPGTTKATLEVTEGRPYSFLFDLDNYGDRATGENHIGATMNLYSPLHLGDQFTLRLQTSSTSDLQNIQSAYSIPVSVSGTSIGLNYSYVNYRLGGLFEPLNAEGNGHNLTLAITQPLIRQRDLTVNATIAGEGSILDDRIESIPLRNQRHTTSWQAGLTSVRRDRILGGGSTSLSLGFVGGQLSIDDSEMLSIDQASTGLHTNGDYSKLTMMFARNQTIAHGLSLYAGAYGQWSKTNLTSSEQLSLGGPGAVRAWQRGESCSDRGVVATTELDYLFGSVGELPGSLQIRTFVDYGYALLHAKPTPGAGNNTRNLTGAGFGMKWFNMSNYIIEATCAWKIAGESDPTDTPMIFVQAVKRF
ncbi:MAG: ShlB/FhaC/HecB family hemolysin secretion/activation protein [Chlorobiaceae bacterium]